MGSEAEATISECRSLFRPQPNRGAREPAKPGVCCCTAAGEPISRDALRFQDLSRLSLLVCRDQEIEAEPAPEPPAFPETVQSRPSSQSLVPAKPHGLAFLISGKVLLTEGACQHGVDLRGSWFLHEAPSSEPVRKKLGFN